MSEEKISTKEFVEMWYEHYQKRLSCVLENKEGYDARELLDSIFAAHHDALNEINIALSIELNNSFNQVSDKKYNLLVYYCTDGVVPPTKNSLHYNDERIMNNTKPEDIDDEELDDFDRLIKHKDTWSLTSALIGENPNPLPPLKKH